MLLFIKIINSNLLLFLIKYLQWVKWVDSSMKIFQRKMTYLTWWYIIEQSSHIIVLYSLAHKSFLENKWVIWIYLSLNISFAVLSLVITLILFSYRIVNLILVREMKIRSARSVFALSIYSTWWVKWEIRNCCLLLYCWRKILK